MLDFLSAARPDDRLQRATAIFVKQTSISEVSKKIAQSIDESLSKQQKEFFLRQQLAAINRELRSLNSPPSSELDGEEQAEQEEMADIRAKVEAMAKDSEERKMAVREWRRLKRTPVTSVEHGVIRNYVRVSLSVLSEHSISPILLARMANCRALVRISTGRPDEHVPCCPAQPQLPCQCPRPARRGPLWAG